MLSGVDIKDWTDDDFDKIIKEMPEKDRRVTYKTDDDGNPIIDLQKFIMKFGRAVVAKIRVEVRNGGNSKEN
jgi:hypothetical protein